MHHRTSGFAIVAAILLAGCGSNGGDTSAAPENAQASTPAAGSAQVDPCGLVTDAEVAEAIGEEIVATKSGEGKCTWETADPETASVSLEFDEANASARMQAARRASAILENIGPEGNEAGNFDPTLDEPIDHRPGAEAFFDSNSQLNVREGFNYLRVTPPIGRTRFSKKEGKLSEAERQAIAREIADRALTRI